MGQARLGLSAFRGANRVTTALSVAACMLAIGMPHPNRAVASQFSVKVWADATGIGGISSSHTITFGPGNLNLFLAEDGTVYSTTGAVGNTPGTFTAVASIPGPCVENEGSAVSTRLGTYYVGSEDCEEAYGFPMTGAGNSIALGSPATFAGEDGSESGAPGAQVEFDDAEGVALMTGTPHFNDANATPFFATVPSSNPLIVNGTTFPIVDANWSGQTLLIVNEESDNLVALLLHTDGTAVTPGVALAIADFTESGNPDAVAVTGDGRFAYVHDESSEDFYRFDLQHVDSTGSNAHVLKFDFPNQNWHHDGLVVLQSALYATADSPDASGVEALFQMAIDPGTGNLGSPEFFLDVRTPSGVAAAGTDSRLATDGTCLYDSNGAAARVFQICPPTIPTPAVGAAGLLGCVALLAVTGLGSLSGRRRRAS